MKFIDSNLVITTYGGTHEDKVGAKVCGFPAGFEVDFDDVQAMLERRRPGSTEFSTKRNEPDLPHVISGIENNRTTGGTIDVFFDNVDVKNAEGDTDYIPRPGHGDFTYYMNTGVFKKGATSARSTVGIVFAGALCKQFLAERGIFVSAKMVSPSESEIKAVLSEGDSIGGIASCSILGLSAGFGNPDSDKLESRIASCIFNIPGVRGLEFGLGFEMANLKGSEANDAFILDNGRVRTATNNCGGILGGMATGSPVEFAVAFKPTPSIRKEQKTVNLKTMEECVLKNGNRFDPCIAMRGAVVVEAAAAIAITDIILESL